jgi:type II secretory pathway pseudopilin PulG
MRTSLWVVGVVAAVLGVLAVIAFPLIVAWKYRQESEQRCHEDCPQHGASYSSISREAIGGSFQCWCKRIRQPDALLPREPGTDCVVFDTDNGTVCKKLDREYEPLRIW